MSKSTEFLKLFEYDPVEDGILRFNITRALNENWDKIDGAFAAQSGILITIPGAWVRGDVNHDGVVDYYDIIELKENWAILGSTLEPGSIEFEAADADGNGSINSADTTYATNNYLSRKNLPEDIMGHWTVDETGKLYMVDIAVPGMQTGDVVDICVPVTDSIMRCGEITGVCLNGTLRLLCEWPPIADTAAYIRYGATETVRIITDASIPSSEDGKHARYCTVVVGTTTMGHTRDDCDFLCDGTKDEAIINRAIIVANGGEVHLLTGTYNLTGNAVTIGKKGTTLSGEGASTILHVGNEYAAIRMDTTCMVRDLKISVTDESSYGIEMGSIAKEYAQIQNVTFDGCYIGMFQNSGNTKFVVKDCIFYECGVGIDAASISASIIANCVFDTQDADSEGTILLGSSTKNNLIIGNLLLGKTVTDQGIGNTVVNNKSE